VFSDNPTRTESILTPQSPLLRHEMARVAWHFTTREYISLREAKLLSNSPREGQFSRPLCQALDHHSAPAAAQTFFSTPTPSDPASGKNIRSEEYLNPPRKYPEHFPPLFRSAFRSALAQQLACSIDSPNINYAESQLAQSVSVSTWKKHISAWNSFRSFLSSESKEPVWPLDLSILRQYTTWAHAVKHLNPRKIEAYLSSLNQLHQLLGFPNLHIRSDFLIQNLIKGSENSRFYSDPAPSRRRTVTFSILKLIGHQIASSSWSINSQLTVWTAALVAF
jgi:hypothetical protein